MQKTIIFFLSILITVSAPVVVASVNNSALQGFHQDMQSEMEKDEPQLLPSVEVLWRSALTKNTTLQLALQKIGEKTGAIKDKKAWTQKLLAGMIQAGGIGGAVALGNPAPMVG